MKLTLLSIILSISAMAHCADIKVSPEPGTTARFATKAEVDQIRETIKRALTLLKAKQYDAYILEVCTHASNVDAEFLKKNKLEVDLEIANMLKNGYLEALEDLLARPNRIVITKEPKPTAIGVAGNGDNIIGFALRNNKWKLDSVISYEDAAEKGVLIVKDKGP